MNLDVEYAIKKDIRNNPVVREVDVQHKRQLMRTIGLTCVVVAMLLFWVWQRFGIVENGYAESVLRAQLALETARNQQLRLEVEMLRAPQVIETQATRDLRMVAPTPATTLVIERPGAGTPRAGAIR
jgi:cell division protein FtsB